MRQIEERPRERGSALVVTVMVLALLMVLGTTLMSTATVESTIAANDRWSEGAFHAAEAAVETALERLVNDSSTDPVETTALGDHYTYRSGQRTDDEAQPPQSLGAIRAEGYGIGSGTGYNAAGFYFDLYQINGTGTGPQNSQREVEIQVEIGPVSR